MNSLFKYREKINAIMIFSITSAEIIKSVTTKKYACHMHATETTKKEQKRHAQEERQNVFLKQHRTTTTTLQCC